MVFAPLEVGDPSAGLPGVEGCPRPVVDDDPEAMRLKSEDELILSRAILGQSLHEVDSNARIQLAVSRSSMERLNAQLSSTDVCEIFSPLRVAGVCKEAGLTPGESMDIKSGYDFDKLADRTKCWDSIIRDEPLLVIGSPPSLIHI